MEKYAFLDKLKAIQSIPYTEQEAQNLWVGSTNGKLHKRHHMAKNAAERGGDVNELDKFPS